MLKTTPHLKFANISEICRICLVTNSNMVYIFDSENKLKIVEKMYNCFNEVINSDDRLPQNICNACIEELFISVKFKEKCMHSRKILNQLIKENNFVREENDYHSNSDNDESDLSLKAIIEKNDYSNSKLSNQTSNHKKNILDSNEHPGLSVENEKESREVGIRNLPVDSCDENELSQNTLKYNLDVNTNKIKDIFKCEICNIEFHNKFSFKNHTRIHSGDRLYKCDKCPKVFFSNSVLKVHNKVTHNAERQVINIVHLVCSECGKSFNCLAYLKRHLVIHAAIKPHECSICKKRFTTKTYLKEHIARHKGDKRFFCEICGAKFISDVNLKQHKVVHGNQNRNFKKHHCTFCHYKTMGRVDLARHIRKHTGEKPFHCPHDGCQSAFAGKASLKLHIRIHTGEKPYECSECLVKFSRQDKYKNHMLKKHNIIIDKNSINRSKLIIKGLT